ncbi:MAG: co-chaperone GroES [Acidobacteria bacterium]|nr:co-chaperone GroES [Acidobacteriota bacterium]
MAIPLPPGTKFKPSEDNYVLELYVATGKQYESQLIIIPDNAIKDVFFGRVVERGPGRSYDMERTEEGTWKINRMPMRFEISADVVFVRWTGERFTINNTNYVVLRADDILTEIQLPDDKHGEYFRLATQTDFEHKNMGDMLEVSRKPS